jgi:hypothetical protein
MGNSDSTNLVKNRLTMSLLFEETNDAKDNPFIKLTYSLRLEPNKKKVYNHFVSNH